ncbi:MAG: Hsp20/alpha crystallin family protein [Candidatus Gracilibacteria bacterium]|nr:Hsp20/alpha crystallin family protein [Candidatus Gracilibacteria bacterium]
MFKLFGVTNNEEIIELDGEIDISNELENEVGQVALDILETPYEIIILAPIAGIELEDIDLTVNKSVLTIKGFRPKPEIYSDEIIVRNQECFWGKFLRNVILPENLDFDSIKANLENNLLIITIQKLKFSSHSIKIDRVEM